MDRRKLIGLLGAGAALATLAPSAARAQAKNLLDQIREMQRAGKAGRARTDNQDVRFELFALGGHHLLSDRTIAYTEPTRHQRKSPTAIGAFCAF